MRLFLKLIFILGLPTLVGISCFLSMKYYFVDPLDPNAAKLELVEIAPGASLKSICKSLEKKQIIRKWWSLLMVAKVRGGETTIKAGEYELSAAMSPKKILDKLAAGEVYKRAVMLKEGESIWHLGIAVENAGLMSRAEFESELSDPNLLTQFGVGAQSFEGYLYPETYLFSRPIRGRDIIWEMLKLAEDHWRPEYGIKAAELSMSRHEVLTLASIIEKESGKKDEQPLVSSVFHNRLKNGMRLESDPTVIYGLPDFKGRLTRADLDNPHPYNTYVNFGLPPGPIANPSESAIKAAVFPANTDFLFFVANGSGGHVFSTTLKDHNKAVQSYRARREKMQKENQEQFDRDAQTEETASSQ